jgi:deoxycytidylate deaminase
MSPLRRDEDMRRYQQKLATMMRFAVDLARLSTCKRHACGCVVVPGSLTAVLAIGYNGPSRGMPNGSCADEPGACGCQHAEVNALVKRLAGSKAVLIVTKHPCDQCAGAIANSGAIAAVVWDGEWVSARGAEKLACAGIQSIPWRVAKGAGDAAVQELWKARRACL